MDIFGYLGVMQEELLKGDLAYLERKYHMLCAMKSGEEEAKRIQGINVEEYREVIEKGMSKALNLAAEHSAKAIYFEYDLDNDWSSNIFICDEYNEPEEEDEDWAADWIDEVDVGTLEEFSEIYSENGFDSTDQALGNTLYLIARTVSLFADVCKDFQTDIPICIAFHDQDQIMRVRE